MLVGYDGGKCDDTMNSDEPLNSSHVLSTLDFEDTQLIEGQSSVPAKQFQVLATLKVEPNDVLVPLVTDVDCQRHEASSKLNADNVSIPTWDFSPSTSSIIRPHVDARLAQTTDCRTTGTKDLGTGLTIDFDKGSQVNNAKPQTITSANISSGKPDLVACQFCTFTCESSEGLLKHECVPMRNADTTKAYKCPYPNCLYSSKRKPGLNNHINSRHKPIEDRPFPCPKCPTRCISKQQLNFHMKRVHIGLRPFACNYCPMTCSSPSDLRTHTYMHTGEKPFQCPHCPYRSISNGHLNQHISGKHGKT